MSVNFVVSQRVIPAWTVVSVSFAIISLVILLRPSKHKPIT